MIHISKMHTLGNDFVIFALDDMQKPTPAWIQQLADRKLGVGCDQVLGYGRIEDQDTTFQYRIFNADGSEVNQCGNGALCLSRFLFEHHAKGQTSLNLRTRSHQMVAKKNPHGISINMGTPQYDPAKLPMTAQQADHYLLQHHQQSHRFYALSLGNPHAVIPVDDVEQTDLNAIGAFFNQHPMFPQGVNVSIIAPIDSAQLHLRVYERGVGETMACGSGACAAAITAITHLNMQTPVTVILPGGKLSVDWPDRKGVWLSGPTTHVFDAELHTLAP
jgi:diaminopimelate epimerase